MPSGVYVRTDENIKERWGDPEKRIKQSERSKKLWENPEYINKQVESKKTLEYQKKQSKNGKDRWENAEYRSKLSEINKKRWENPEKRKKQSDTIRGYWEDVDYRKKVMESQITPEHMRRKSEISKKQWENPEMRKKISEAIEKYYENPEARRKSSELKNKYYENPHSNHYNYCWYGNVSYNEYIACELWKQVNSRTKSFHGHRCIWCGQQILSHLTGHHVFYEKQACCLSDPETGIYYTNLNVKNHPNKDYIIGENPNYFVSLCQECHGESNGNFDNRAMWADRLRELVDQTGKCYFKIGIEDDLYNIFKKRCVIPSLGFTGDREYQDYENKYKNFLHL